MTIFLRMIVLRLALALHSGRGIMKSAASTAGAAAAAAANLRISSSRTSRARAHLRAPYEDERALGHQRRVDPNDPFIGRCLSNRAPRILIFFPYTCRLAALVCYRYCVTRIFYYTFYTYNSSCFEKTFSYKQLMLRKYNI